ncbi:hypothetical protein PGN35_002275 [Nodosilinea sp. PGN35]|uniref:hypothetical protein n=1 Tax=Nodosilinea sp. PGN35 TaxID=3020489 RepID=UPI0023B2AE82|nr:hypothetical protein [Nodosilinea sp. TSF1-S3]MDF0368766.1 hypothetical protein [Nodosilinea sp. TSF1-S3]
MVILTCVGMVNNGRSPVMFSVPEYHDGLSTPGRRCSLAQCRTVPLNDGQAVNWGETSFGLNRHQPTRGRTESSSGAGRFPQAKRHF